MHLLWPVCVDHRKAQHDNSRHKTKNSAVSSPGPVTLNPKALENQKPYSLHNPKPVRISLVPDAQRPDSARTSESAVLTASIHEGFKFKVSELGVRVGVSDIDAMGAFFP